MHLLFVCTGNICRSPIAERLTVAYGEEARARLGGSLTASSAGTAAVVGHPMESSAILVLRGLGGSPEGFLARQLTLEHIEPADLVFTMTRRQRSAVLQIAPRMLSRTFTLREAASLLTGADRARLAQEPDLGTRGRQLAANLAQLRSARIVQRDRQRDDIRDPIGGDLEKFQRVGDAIAASLLPLLDALCAGPNPYVLSPASAAPPDVAAAPLMPPNGHDPANGHEPRNGYEPANGHSPANGHASANGQPVALGALNPAAPVTQSVPNDETAPLMRLPSV